MDAINPVPFHHTGDVPRPAAAAAHAITNGVVVGAVAVSTVASATRRDTTGGAAA